MSDCLICGVLPAHDVDPEVKRASTVFIRPFTGFSQGESTSSQLLGAPVGIYPIAESKRTTNPRDLTWSEFEAVQYLVGTVQEIHVVPDSTREDGLVRCDGTVDFGSTRGVSKASAWLRSESVKDEDLLKSVQGHQVIAATNLEGSDVKDLFDADTAAILTVNGLTMVEPAKHVEDGFKLA
jgi:hypothetical protein